MPRLFEFVAASAASVAVALTTDWYVDCTGGSDTNAGTSPSAAFLTLNRARDAIRAQQPISAAVTVHVAAGDCYPRNPTGAVDFTVPVLTLNNATGDGGTASAPISWVADGNVRLMAGLTLPAQYWQPANGLPNVFSYDLGLAGYDFAAFGFGSLSGGGLGQCVNNQAEIFFNSQPQTLARWPNVDPSTGYFQWSNIQSVVNASSFTVNVSRPVDNNWGAEPDAWVHGYWSFDWADSFVALGGVSALPPVNGAPRTQLTNKPSTPPLYGYLPKARWYAVNILAELDAPGEYYINKTGNGTLYFYPPAAPSPSSAPYAGTHDPALYSALLSGETVISMGTNVLVLANAPSSAALEHPSPYEAMRAAALPAKASHSSPSSSLRANRASTASLSAEDEAGLRRVRAIEQAASDATAGVNGSPGPLSNVIIDGFSLAFSRGIALGATVLSYVRLSNLDISNHGQKAASVYGVTGVVMDNITATNLGCSAIGMGGGSQSTLSPGNNVLSNSRISGYARVCRTYEPAIAWSGVGNSFTGNEISNAPHSGILGGGNDNVFSGNYLHDLCFEVSDSGSWYAGRSWVNRGNVVTNNTFLRIAQTVPIFLGAPAVQAIYLDDQLSGQVVTNNTIIDSHTGLLLGGGRDNYVAGNVFKNLSSGLAMTFDNRGMNWQTSTCTWNATYTGLLVQQLYSVHYQQPPYSTAYPELPGLLGDHPCVPVNNTVIDNEYCGCSQGFIDRNANTTASWYSNVANNVELSNCS